MTDWLLIFAGGLLGSSHCVGMCGAFVLALGSHPDRLARDLLRQVVYALGRICTYASAGAVAGYGGARLATLTPSVLNIQGVLSILAGVLLLIQGISAAGVFPWVSPLTGPPTCPGTGFFAAWLGATRLRSVFLGGIVNGFLPCGLVYAYLALAASSGDVFRGWAIMALFGAGTLPVLALLGVSGRALAGTWRRRVFRVAAWCILVMGILALVRGVCVLQLDGACPCLHCL